jgi:hypothetical protein
MASITSIRGGGSLLPAGASTVIIWVLTTCSGDDYSLSFVC